MAKDKDWNAAIIGGEDWKAATDSEVFRNFVKIALAEEAQEAKAQELRKQAEANKPKVVDTLDGFLEFIKKADFQQAPTYVTPIVESYIPMDEESFADTDLRSPEEKQAAMDAFDALIKEAALNEAEEELGLSENTYYSHLSQLRDK